MTQIIITGTLTPNARGTYDSLGTRDGQNVYYKGLVYLGGSNISADFCCYYRGSHDEWWIATGAVGAVGSEVKWFKPGILPVPVVPSTPEGVYTENGGTGIPTVIFAPTLYANTIRSYFKTAIADLYALPTQYDNQGKAAQPMPWCRLTLLPGESIQTSLGVRQYRTTGIMEAQLFYPLETGDAAALTMATIIRNAFKSLSLSGGVQFRTPTIRVIGRMNAEFQVNISCPFYVNE